MPLFERYVGVDYSGAATAEASLKEIRVYAATLSVDPSEIVPPPSPRKYWSRRGVAEWLLEQLSGETPIIVGIDHAFSFPLAYVKRHGLPLDWPGFLDDFSFTAQQTRRILALTSSEMEPRVPGTIATGTCHGCA
jgi:hypothetical protein